MKTFSVFILGLLFGWLIEWIIDWFYWRNKYQQVAQENNSLKQHIASLEAKKQTQPKPRAKRSPGVKQKVKPKKDDLTLISGIGPVIAKKLNAAGITTFEQMAKLKPNQLEGILGELVKRLADEADLIAQAKKLAAKKKPKAK